MEVNEYEIERQMEPTKGNFLVAVDESKRLLKDPVLIRMLTYAKISAKGQGEEYQTFLKKVKKYLVNSIYYRRTKG